MEYKYDPLSGYITGLTSNGWFSDKGYVKFKVDGKDEFAHKLAFIAMGVPVPEGMQVDHINHDRADNRWINLRLVTCSENMKNKSKYKNNVSGVPGVRWADYANRWRAVITIDRKQISLGTFVEFSEAVNARKNAEVLYGFHANHGKVV